MSDDKPEMTVAEPRPGSPEHVAFWDAIHAYARASYTGEERSAAHDSGRMDAVVAVERAARAWLGCRDVHRSHMPTIVDLLETERDGLRAEVERLRNAVARLRGWAHTFGPALIPPGADTYGEGMRDAKGQVDRMLDAALPAGEDGAR